MSCSDWLDVITVATAVIGLFIVIISLQQTRRIINAASYQHILDREADNWNHVRSASKSVQLSALRHFGLALDESTDPGTIEMLLDHIALFNFYEGIFLQKRQRALNNEIWQIWDRSLDKTMKNPEIRQTWEIVKTVYSPKFAEHVVKTNSQAGDAS